MSKPLELTVLAADLVDTNRLGLGMLEVFAGRILSSFAGTEGNLFGTSSVNFTPEELAAHANGVSFDPVRFLEQYGDLLHPMTSGFLESVAWAIRHGEQPATDVILTSTGTARGFSRRQLNGVSLTAFTGDRGRDVLAGNVEIKDTSEMELNLRRRSHHPSSRTLAVKWMIEDGKLTHPLGNAKISTNWSEAKLGQEEPEVTLWVRRDPNDEIKGPRVMQATFRGRATPATEYHQPLRAENAKIELADGQYVELELEPDFGNPRWQAEFDPKRGGWRPTGERHIIAHPGATEIVFAGTESVAAGVVDPEKSQRTGVRLTEDFPRGKTVEVLQINGSKPAPRVTRAAFPNMPAGLSFPDVDYLRWAFDGTPDAEIEARRRELTASAIKRTYVPFAALLGIAEE